MKNTKKDVSKVSIEARQKLNALHSRLVRRVEHFLGENQNLIFEENVNMSFFDEEMRLMLRRHGRCIVLSAENKSGATNEHELKDQGHFSIHDLIWIVEQIEREEGI